MFKVLHRVLFPPLPLFRIQESAIFFTIPTEVVTSDCRYYRSKDDYDGWCRDDFRMFWSHVYIHLIGNDVLVPDENGRKNLVNPLNRHISNWNQGNC